MMKRIKIAVIAAGSGALLYGALSLSKPAAPQFGWCPVDERAVLSEQAIIDKALQRYIKEQDPEAIPFFTDVAQFHASNPKDCCVIKPRRDFKSCPKRDPNAAMYAPDCDMSTDPEWLVRGTFYVRGVELPDASWSKARRGYFYWNSCEGSMELNVY